MKPPKSPATKPTRLERYSRCLACDKFTPDNRIFHHENRYWILCKVDYADYWENTDNLATDYKGYL